LNGSIQRLLWLIDIVILYYIELFLLRQHKLSEKVFKNEKYFVSELLHFSCFLINIAFLKGLKYRKGLCHLEIIF